MKRLLVLLVLCTAGVAAAEEQPWEVGVSKENRDKANAVFAEGNQMFAQQAHGPALDKYKEAIQLWDHPLIRFNMAVTYVRLDRILEAADAIDAALRFGAAPYSPEHYQQAQDYQRLINGRIGTVEASCAQSGVSVLLDGKPWFSCPGSKKQRVLIGEHLVVGEKKDFATESRRLVVAPQATSKLKLELRSFESAVVLEYPSPRWLPWTVAATGGAVVLGGVAFWFAARNQMDRFEAAFATACPTGCPASLAEPKYDALREQRDSARLSGTIAISMWAAGSAIAAGGVVWVLLNKPKRILPNVEVAPTDGGMQATVGWSY